MPIQVKCPNAECGKVMTVKDEFAGKRGKCPGCGKPFPIPAAPKAKKPADDEDDQDSNPYVVSETPEEKAAKEAEARKAQRKRKRRSEDDEEDEDEDDDEEESKQRKKKKKEKEAETLMVGGLLGAGMVFLVCLALTSQLNWFSVTVTGSGKDFDPQSVKKLEKEMVRWEGKVLLGVSLAAAALAGIALGLYFAMDRETAEHYVTAGACFAEAWGVSVLLWLLGFMWLWIVSVRYKVEYKLQTLPEVNVQFLPDMGLIIAVVMSLGAVVVFSYVITKMEQKGWLWMSQLMGIIVGVLLVVLDVKPWDAR